MTNAKWLTTPDKCTIDLGIPTLPGYFTHAHVINCLINFVESLYVSQHSIHSELFNYRNTSICLPALCFSLLSLQQLEVLDLSEVDYSNSVLEVVGQINSLTELYLKHCRLQELPER